MMNSTDKSEQLHRRSQSFLVLQFHRKKIIFVCLLFTVLLFVFFWQNGKSFRDGWVTVADPVITATTFSIAVIFAIIGLYHNWLSSLPGRLTVHFAYYHDKEYEKRIGKKEEAAAAENYISELAKLGFRNGNCYILMSCQEATLAFANDARAWAQQIGAQMNGNRPINFYPFIRTEKTQVRKVRLVDGTVVYFRLFTLFMYLSSVPETVLKGKQYLTWKENYDDSPFNEQVTANKFPLLEEMTGNN